MAILRMLASRIRGAFASRRGDDVLDEEIQSHLDLLTEEHVRRGLPLEDARRAARREFGGVTQMRERHRDQRGLPALESVAADVRYAVRTLAKTPGFTAVTIVTLAVAIGANSSIFTLINALVLRELPVRHPDQLVQVSLTTPNGDRGGLSLPMFEELDRRQDVFSAALVYSGGGVVTVEVGGGFSLASVWAVDGNFHEQLGQAPALGRLLTPADIDPRTGAVARTVVLSDSFWQRWFDRNPDVIGRELRIQGLPFTIVGVTRPGFSGLGLGEDPVVTIPLYGLASALRMTESQLRDRGRTSLSVVARLKPGVSIEQARVRLESLRPELLAAVMPDGYAGEQRDAFLARRFDVQSASTGVEWFLRTNFTRPLYVLMGIVGVILLVACVHLASLMLARTAAREHDISLRLALGASRWRVCRQLLVESVLLSLTGALLGLAFARWTSTMLADFMTQQYLVVPRFNLAPDGAVLAVTTTLAVLTGILFGLAPIWFTARRDPASALQGNTVRVQHSTGAIGKGLIVVQVALSIVVLTGAGLLARSVDNLRSADAGFQRDGLLLTRLMPRPGGYDNFEPNVYQHDLLNRLKSLPGVQAASFTRERPGNATPPRDTVGGMPVLRSLVSPGFFETLNVSLTVGRDFEWTDDGQRTRVAILSRNLATRLFPSGNPVGHQIRVGADPRQPMVQIVGVVEDTRMFDLRTDAPFILYLPAMQYPQFFRQGILAVRAAGDSSSIVTAITSAVDALGREYAWSIQTGEEVTDQGLAAERLTAGLARFFAMLALILAAIGLYGLMAYTVTRRTREIGIRMALGAEGRFVMWDVVKDALILVALGVVIGIPSALAATRVIAGMLFGLGHRDPATLAAVSATLLAVGALAAFIPARRASRVDPMVALRTQ